jgi:hypothetical protein
LHPSIEIQVPIKTPEGDLAEVACSINTRLIGDIKRKRSAHQFDHRIARLQALDHRGA